jgi:hypothetical protein
VWERSLFPKVKVLDLPALLEVLTNNVDLYLASDGGAIPLKGSFGAVLATFDTILVECGGRAFGQDPCSFRSEAYGFSPPGLPSVASVSYDLDFGLR